MPTPRPPLEIVDAFIQAHSPVFGVDPICAVLQIAPSAYRMRCAQQPQPEQRSARRVQDEILYAHIERISTLNLYVYGARKIWHALKREGIETARCTVERLMRTTGIAGMRRGKSVRTTHSNSKDVFPLDHVNRKFSADRLNLLWVSDFTYVSTSQGMVSMVRKAFVIDVFSRAIVGWRVSSSMTTDFVLDALEQALYARNPEDDPSLIHHRDRGSQYVSIRYSERLKEAGIEPSVGSTGDSYERVA